MGVGHCDRTTGEFKCMTLGAFTLSSNQLFEGTACGRIACPYNSTSSSACGGKGSCLSMSQWAAKATDGQGTVLGLSYSGSTSAKDQTMACPEGIHFFWLWLNAIFLTLMGVSGFMFPIHGERLVALIKKQGDAQKARAGTKASELTNNTPNPSVTVTTAVVKIVETPTIVETPPAVTEVPTELDE